MSFNFPDDLVQLQRDWFAADEARTTAAGNGDDEGFAAAHAQLQDLTMALHRHPTLQAVEDGHAARTALREAARARDDG